jgi:glucans biosynthesis protein
MQTILPTRENPAPPRRRAGRWIRPDLAAAPCGARTRAGTPCRAPCVRGKHRCRMHGGAPGAGAARGNRNAVKHGWWSAAERHERTRAAALVEAGRRMLAEVAEGDL